MPTECNPTSMRFARLKGRDVVADFGGGTMTSDAGALLLGATDRTIGLVARFSDCFSDGRAADRVVHDVERRWWVSGYSGLRWATRTLWTTTSCAATRFRVRFWAGWKRAVGIACAAGGQVDAEPSGTRA